MPRPALLLALLIAVSGPVRPLELDDYRLVDLTQPHNAETVYWPTSSSKFELETLAEGYTSGGWHYLSYLVCTPEHGGTHLDAPPERWRR